MNCQFFGICGGCALPLSYEAQFEHKRERYFEIMHEIDLPEADIFLSPHDHYRDRGEFRVWHEESGVSLAMFKKGGAGAISISECPSANRRFSPSKIVDFLNDNPNFAHKLFEIDFLCGNDGNDMVIALIFHKKLDAAIIAAAEKLSKKLESSLILRSKNERVLIGRDYVISTISAAEKQYSLIQREGHFSQPNGSINQAMIGWAENEAKNAAGDLLELYCGGGNFTIPLSCSFNKVLAIESAKSSIKTAQENAALNNIENISFARLNAEEFSIAAAGERKFNRLAEIDLNSFDFQTIFVDPPRSGLDEKSLALAQSINTIIYISCNPATLSRDLAKLAQTHKVVSLALFDQFPYTLHLESAVVLQRF
ncbi:tRNA/tmRNA (uracil-C(5))-methyltransferase [Campylobacterota bacterium]|nr:tRNA/tmRNA (uracil-C(5))-methyltransferase [Campylobacterota bacterium]